MRGPKRGPRAAAESALDPEQPVEQRAGGELGVDLRDGVEEPGLVFDPDRGSIANRREAMTSIPGPP